jgi:hypothetical protein
LADFDLQLGYSFRRIADRYKKCDVAKYRWYDIYRNGLIPERWPMRQLKSVEYFLHPPRDGSWLPGENSRMFMNAFFKEDFKC